MRLDRLEIAGFKSFPDRADLTFDRGVTAIVGPNGCGKSNVVDAITWVLGEQSAKSLRGDRMEDVIFNGSDARKPTGAAEVRLRLSGIAAEVIHHAADPRNLLPDGLHGPAQIVLPSTETREVEIARRLYRSGESEYLVDGEVCRLRDVQDLLMDAGVGVKQYAIIEQGKIGLILNSKPTDRRVLIEEAAGVTKYKSRRRAAELKLEAAQQNLTRVDDIVYELEKQRASLKRQAGRARRYRKLREELRRWEKVLFTRRYHVLAQAIESARTRLADARSREAAAADHLAHVERVVTDLRRGLGEAEQGAARARDAAHARELEKDRREQQLTFDRQQVEDLAAAAADLSLELQALASRREPARVEIEGRRDAAGRASTERDAAAERLASEEEQYAAAQRRIEALEQEVESARAQVYAAINTETTLRNVIERAGEARERIAAELNRLEAEASDLRIETDRFSAEQEQVGTALAGLHAAIDQALTARAARELQLAQARNARDEAQRALRERERESESVAARLLSLEELEAARAGYGEAARHVLADPDTGIAHFGSVADHLETTRDYERAVEAVLGDLLQSVIVRTHDEAARGLAFVRDRKLGRCSFVVLDADAPTVSAGPRPDGVVSLSSRFRVGGPHAALLARLAGEGWFAESADAARAASAQTAAPVVTVAGEVFRGGHLVSGGSPVEARGILATKREIKELRDRIDDDHRAVERLAGDVARIDDAIGLAQIDVTRFGAELHDREKAAIGHELQARRAAEEIARLSRRAELNHGERQRAEEERRQLEEREEHASRQIADLAEERGSLDRQMAEAQRELQGAREGAEERSRQVADAKAAHAALSERALGLLAEVGRLEDASRELEARFTARHDEVGRNAQRREDLTLAIAALERQLDEDRQAFASLQADVLAADERVAALQKEFTSAEDEVGAARGALDEVRAVVGQLDLARATAESDLAHLSSTCHDALQMTVEEVAREVDALEAGGQAAPDPSVIYADEEADDDLEAPPDADGTPAQAGHDAVAAGLAARALTAEEAIAELRSKIDRLGPVNMMAIEQFDELEQRHAFLTAQRQDLVESIAQTGEAIKRIEKTTRERFREAFTAINAYFETTFTTLFGGGRAGLILLDEDDLLESGVDIIAQPPGKRLQNVSLLSGGEKALTAMALMFAIFRYRPSPFCLLDEIDAPLDDANIGRFLEMLYGMLDRTQFIIITHSRKTMEIADRLYGVTMEEPGVSKLISLQLN